MKPCCQNEDNLLLISEKNGMEVYQCQVCGCKHYVANVEPGVIFGKGAPL